MEADAAQDNLMQVQRDEDGLTITVHTPPSEPDTVSMLVYFAGIAMTLAGGSVIFAANNWVGVLPFLGGIVLVAIMFGHRTQKSREQPTVTIYRYRTARPFLSITEGFVVNLN